MSDKARWSWRAEVWNTCETWSISIMAMAGSRSGLCLDDRPRWHHLHFRLASRHESLRQFGLSSFCRLPPEHSGNPPMLAMSISAWRPHRDSKRLSTARTGAASRPRQLQRQRNQFVVAGRDFGQHEIFDDANVVTPARHVRRQVFSMSPDRPTGTSTPIRRVPRIASCSTASGARVRNPVGHAI